MKAVSIEEMLSDSKVVNSLIAVMEYLEEILAEKKLLSGADTCTQEMNFSNVDMSVTIKAADASAGNTHISLRR